MKKNNTPFHFRLGTRASLLAQTQTRWAKKQLESLALKLFPEESISWSISSMETQGDQKTDKPLWQLEGKDFFTKELDKELLEKQVDLVVHSYKDLSTQRPCEFLQACFPKRIFPQDVLLLTRKTREALQRKEKQNLKIGTASPRRQAQLQSFLPQFLPHGQTSPVSLQIENLRGNVPRRLQRLLSGDFEGIVLAFAGLERLSQDEEGKQQLSKLLKETPLDFLILPVRPFTPGPGQGALCLECLKDPSHLDSKAQEILFTLLRHLEDSETKESCQREKSLFASLGGGCHLPFGAYSLKIKDAKTQGVKFFDAIFGEQEHPFSYHTILEKKQTFIGLSPNSVLFKKIEEQLEGLGSTGTVKDEWTFLESKTLTAQERHSILSSHLFLTTHHALNSPNLPDLGEYSLENPDALFWTAGLYSTKALLSRFPEIWINGVGDFSPEQGLQAFKKSSFLSLISSIQKNKWCSLGPPLNYKRNCHPEPKNLKALKTCEQFIWSSPSQFDLLSTLAPEILSPEKHHFAMWGKTFHYLAKKDISLSPFLP